LIDALARRIRKPLIDRFTTDLVGELRPVEGVAIAIGNESAEALKLLIYALVSQRWLPSFDRQRVSRLPLKTSSYQDSAR